jgi:acetyl-CoA carboxylase carboxyl transferase alpha subunit/acetyl-CoA carboxylase carboxyl transferase beta subunit
MGEQLTPSLENTQLAERLAALPSNRWTKCLQCGAFIYYKHLDKNLKVCPECNYHFRLSAYERIRYLLDAGSFQECAPDLSPDDPLGFVDSMPYPARIQQNRRKTGLKEAAVYGTGTIGGYPIIVCALDFAFLGGSMGSVVGEKVTQACELGIETRTPVLICSASGGARMQEGILSLMQMAKTSAALARLAEVGIPYFSLLADPTYGGVSASFATLGDLILAEPGVRAGFAGPQVIEQTIRQKLPSGFQTAEFLLEKGQIDLIVPRAELPNTLKKLLLFHADHTVARGRTNPRPSEQKLLPVPNCSAWESVQLARHRERPNIRDYIDGLFDNFTELHGDRTFRDDAAVVGGLALLDGRPVMVIGHQKGRNTRENIERNFGMPHPEGYRKALRLMQYAGRFHIPLLTFIDTPGAYPGLAAEERNQSEAIARCLAVMSRLPIPIISTIIGEGGSGGALAFGLGDRVLMLENAIYAVISPEGCATILFKDATKAPLAAERSRLTAHELYKLGVADEVVPEPSGGSHLDSNTAIASLKEALLRHLDNLIGVAAGELVETRYQRFRCFGSFSDEDQSTGGEADQSTGTAA